VGRLVGLLVLVVLLVVIHKFLGGVLGRWRDLTEVLVLFVWVMPGGVEGRLSPGWWTGPGQVAMVAMVLLLIPWGISGVFLGARSE